MEKFSLSKPPVLEEEALYNMCIEDGEARIPWPMSTVGIEEAWKRRNSVWIPPLTWPCATVAQVDMLLCFMLLIRMRFVMTTAV